MTDPLHGPPIFIGGCDRSGTTLLGAMLGAHPACVSPPEARFLPDGQRAIERGELSDEPSALVPWLRRHRAFRAWVFDPPDAQLEGPGGLAALMRRLAAAWAEHRGRPGAEHWVDHSPANLRSAGLLLKLFPEARFVHILRDGRGVAASILPLDWGPNHVATAATWWVEKVAHGLALEAHRPERTWRVRYEELVSEPERVLRALAPRLGLAWDPAMLRADGTSLPRNTRGQHRLVGSPADPSRADSWAETLHPREIEIFENLTDEFLENLGYELRHGGRARRMTRTERIGARLTELWRGGLVNPVHLRLKRLRLITSR